MYLFGALPLPVTLVLTYGPQMVMSLVCVCVIVGVLSFALVNVFAVYIFSWNIQIDMYFGCLAKTRAHSDVVTMTTLHNTRFSFLFLYSVENHLFFPVLIAAHSKLFLHQ